MVPRILLMFALTSVGAACSLLPDPRPADRLVVASWNVENLFDEVADGDEYPEFDPNRGWTRAQFWARCTALARVIRTLAEGGADVLVLQEVEGEHALEVLNSRFLADLAYRYRFVAPAAVTGIKTAVLSRFPLVRTGLVFPSPAEADESLRPLVEAELDLGGRRLVLVGNHWKSRIPTPEATEPLRRRSAEALHRVLTALEARPDRPFVLALGDFNTSLELSRPWADKALVSGPSASPGEAALVVFENRRSAEQSRLPGAVWDPWSTVLEPPGSYAYHGDWNRLDHVFVPGSSLRLGGWTFGSFRAVAYAPLPQAYGPRTPNGVSDHFPVVLTLVRHSASP